MWLAWPSCLRRGFRERPPGAARPACFTLRRGSVKRFASVDVFAGSLPKPLGSASGLHRAEHLQHTRIYSSCYFTPPFTRCMRPSRNSVTSYRRLCCCGVISHASKLSILAWCSFGASSHVASRTSMGFSAFVPAQVDSKAAHWSLGRLARLAPKEDVLGFRGQLRRKDFR